MANVNDLLAKFTTSTSSQTPPGNLENVSSKDPTAAGRKIASSSLSQRPSSDQTATLLNLLKFNAPPVAQPSAMEDLIRIRTSPDPTQISATAGVSDPQQALLKLLNRPQKSPLQGPATREVRAPAISEQHSRPNAQHISSQPVFSYVNPFEALAASVATPASNDNGSIKSLSAVSMKPPEVRDSPLHQPSHATSRYEAVKSIEAAPSPPATVGEALQEAGEHVNEEASDALARAEANSTDAKLELQARNAIQNAAVELQKSLKTPAIKDAFEGDMPAPMARGFEEAIDEIAHPSNASQELETKAVALNGKHLDTKHDTRMYGFPIKPYTSINLSNTKKSTASLREDSITNVAKLKRDFDQIDRSLVSASENFITYAMASTGGFRVVSQTDGSNLHAFKRPDNRVFNISVASYASSPKTEPVLAVNHSGSVFWTEVPSSEEEFRELNPAKAGFEFPPLPSTEDNTSGAAIKTRAKLSSKHPEFFGISRGKNIYIVYPSLVRQQMTDSASEIVDVAKYQAEFGVKIPTGKSGKDFTFSHDDSLILSLDKVGKLKFWDIEEQIAPDHSENRLHQGNNKTPLLTLATSSPEKSWATSVQFIDTEKTSLRGLPARYLLVGSRQNHTLHLWDLALSKPVQEITFPHSSDSDAACSVAFNPRSRIILVGHPTRNSMYILKVSLPSHKMPQFSQAAFIRAIASKDKPFPAPKMTAIIAGVREISLDKIGQLRSLEILQPQKPAETDQKIAFEAYICHSNGITCIYLENKDIGLDENHAQAPYDDAEKAGIATCTNLRVSAPIEPDAGFTPQQIATNTTRVANSKSPINAGTPSKGLKTNSAIPKTDLFVRPASTNGTNGASGHRELKVDMPAPPVQDLNSWSIVLKDGELSSQPLAAASINQTVRQGALQAGNDAGKVSDLVASSAVFSQTVSATFNEHLDKLYRRIEEDKRVQDAAGAAKQDAILRLVSSTLTNNVEVSLSNIVTRSIEKSVLPSINAVITRLVERFFAETFPSLVQSGIAREVKSSLAPSISSAYQEPETVRILTDIVNSKISTNLGSTISTILHDSLIPSLDRSTADSAQRISVETDKQVQHHLDRANKQHNERIGRLTAITEQLAQTVENMQLVQRGYEQDIALLREELSHRQAASMAAADQLPVAAQRVRDPEMDAISHSLSTGNFEQSTMLSARRADVFDEIFMHVNPSYIRDVNQVLVLSVSAAIVEHLQANTLERLRWLDSCLTALDAQSSEINGYVGGVMEAIMQRLQESFMVIAENAPGDQMLQTIMRLMRRAKDINNNLRPLLP